MSERLSRAEIESARVAIEDEIRQAEREVNDLALKAATRPVFDKPLLDARAKIQSGYDKLAALKRAEEVVAEDERQAQIVELADVAREDLISAIVVLHQRLPAIAELDRALAAAKEACEAVTALTGKAFDLTHDHLNRLDRTPVKSFSTSVVSGWNNAACLRPYDTDVVGSWLNLVGNIPTNFLAGYEGSPERALADLKRRLPEVVDEEFEREVERRVEEAVG